jgi:AcrR family transcriptional regulator
MPRNVFTMDVLDSVLDALLRAIVVRGELAPSLRTLAADAGMSAAGIVHHFGTRSHALKLAARRWADERADTFGRCRSPVDLPTIIPGLPAEVDEVVVDFSLTAMARGHEGIARSLSRLRVERRCRLADAAPVLDATDLDLLLAAIEGLRYATALPVEPLDCQAARDALARLVDLLLGAEVTSAS